MNQNTNAILVTDKEWGSIDGLICRITEFNPIGSFVDADGNVKAMDLTTTYAAITFDNVKIGRNITGYISHKQDFSNLWEAFRKRKVKEDEEVLMVWTKKYYRRGIIFKGFMPKLYLVICHRGAFDLITKYWNDPKNSAIEFKTKGSELIYPIAECKPEVMDLTHHWLYWLMHG